MSSRKDDFMTKKKNQFLTFCFSLLPGAGQMYMGFMKRGLSLMFSFFFLIFLSSWLNIGSLLLVLPIVWFFAFFDTHNLRSMPDEEFEKLKDDYIILPDLARKNSEFLYSRYRKVLAVVLIIIGFDLLWHNFIELFLGYLPAQLYSFLIRLTDTLPQIIIGIAIIALGVILIRGKKKELDASELGRQYEDKAEEKGEEKL